MLPLHEAQALVAWYHAGAHPDALARAFARDRRTIRATLRRAGVVLRTPEPPLRLPTEPMPVAARQALQAYRQQWEAQQQTVERQVAQAAQATTPTGYLLRPRDYTPLLVAARPATSLAALAVQLGLDLNQVLLTYADWADHYATAEARLCSPQG